MVGGFLESGWSQLSWRKEVYQEDQVETRSEKWVVVCWWAYSQDFRENIQLGRDATVKE